MIWYIRPIVVLSLTAFVSAALAGAEPRNIPDLNLTMMPIPAGIFVMGSPANEAGRNDNEGPQTKVTISYSFWLGHRNRCASENPHRLSKKSSARFGRSSSCTMPMKVPSSGIGYWRN
jgi:hypothetical protein